MYLMILVYRSKEYTTTLTSIKCTSSSIHTIDSNKNSYTGEGYSIILMTSSGDSYMGIRLFNPIELNDVFSFYVGSR